MKKTYIQIDGKWVEKPARRTDKQTMIMPDIEPYQSMRTFEMIGGRSQHREHLRKHGLVEIGSEKVYE